MAALINQKINSLSEEIKALPYFVNGDCKIERLTGGESHQCFKVTVNKNAIEKSVFVKSLTGHQQTAQAEIASNLVAAEKGVAPAIIYYSASWLVAEFITGNSLTDFYQQQTGSATMNKVTVAMNLMVKTHQLTPPVNHPILAIKKLLYRQASNIKLSQYQHVALDNIIGEITPLQTKHSNLVLCHGDVNYENIRLSASFNAENPLEHAWLVDFECSSLAEAEYDIAMFIAINKLGIKDINAVIHDYQQFSHAAVNEDKVRAYLACCYLINGLWYFEAGYQHKQAQRLIANAHQQLILFDQLGLLKEKITLLF
ncbi:phosphotransferase [Colwellia hornerae]|uniref:Phosphotransferase n=1 Tax=Colwellia hornerae TaxID=89402 RepID=A0A5C6Q9Y6_9GAMM|nr:phosphotransferase [Colwellia hornerae]TWX51061.1 phosphotransferase [Colwellia hornerae]TWX56739.1 phosphotransferase [Colwellia hornerae]TWX65709.1 phosphotransferase [Colwellia hornerae]